MVQTWYGHIRAGSVVVAVAAALLGGNYFRIANHIADVEARGIGALAHIDGGRVNSARKGGGTMLTLSWTDRDGVTRRAQDVVVSAEFAAQIVNNGTLTVSVLPIHYLTDVRAGEPVIDADLANRRATSEQGWRIMTAVAGLVVLIAIGCSLLGRRHAGTATA